ncbi:CHASE2 domain-containing protein [Desulfobacterales bacterium HSG2]|nr:CHASE2 domain-containing protein [Desulfobacterales bacterium HSG2]
MYLLSQIIKWLKANFIHVLLEIIKWLKANFIHVLLEIIKWLKANRMISLSVIHALWMLILTFVWLNRSVTYGDEMFLIQMTSGVKRLILGLEEKPDKNDFLFVNVAYDRKLIEKRKNGIFSGNQDITDRAKLAQFFRVLSQRPDNHRFILCDIFFRDPSPDDRMLLTEMRKMRHILIPYHKTAPGRWEFPIFDGIESGAADYTTADTKGTFLKFALTGEDMRKTIPLRMYERLHSATFRKKGFLYLMNGKLSLNSVILDFRIRNSHLNEGGYYGDFCMNLWELLSLPDAVLHELTKDRIIVIGDLKERDMHETVFGETAGTLILLNAYLSLVNKENIVSAPLIMVLFGVCLLLSFHIFSGKTLEERQWRIRMIRSVIRGRFIAKLVNYLLVLGAFSVILYFIFNIHINILLIAAYLTVLESVIRYVGKKRQSPVP